MCPALLLRVSLRPLSIVANAVLALGCAGAGVVSWQRRPSPRGTVTLA